MNHAAVIEKYLKERRRFDDLFLNYPFLTISREVGAGGHTIAREVIRRLEDNYPKDDMAQGWEVFDQKLCAMILKNTKIKVSFESLVTEEYVSEARQFISDLLSGQSTQYALFRKTFGIIRLLSRIGKVVIVGRGGANLTADLPQGVHVRLVAGKDERVRRMAAMLDVEEDKARTLVRDQDRNRARLVKSYFNKEIGDPHVYDAVYNTETLAIEGIADSIVALIHHKMDLVKSGAIEEIKAQGGRFRKRKSSQPAKS